MDKAAPRCKSLIGRERWIAMRNGRWLFTKLETLTRQ